MSTSQTQFAISIVVLWLGVDIARIVAPFRTPWRRTIVARRFGSRWLCIQGVYLIVSYEVAVAYARGIAKGHGPSIVKGRRGISSITATSLAGAHP